MKEIQIFKKIDRLLDYSNEISFFFNSTAERTPMDIMNGNKFIMFFICVYLYDV